MSLALILRPTDSLKVLFIIIPVDFQFREESEPCFIFPTPLTISKLWPPFKTSENRTYCLQFFGKESTLTCEKITLMICFFLYLDK